MNAWSLNASVWTWQANVWTWQAKWSAERCLWNHFETSSDAARVVSAGREPRFGSMPAVCRVKRNAGDGLTTVCALPVRRSFFESSEPSQAIVSTTKTADGPNGACGARQMPAVAMRETRSASSGQSVRLFVIELGRTAARMDAMSHDATTHDAMSGDATTLGVMTQMPATGELNRAMIWRTIAATERGGSFGHSTVQPISV